MPILLQHFTRKQLTLSDILNSLQSTPAILSMNELILFSENAAFFLCISWLYRVDKGDFLSLGRAGLNSQGTFALMSVVFGLLLGVV